MKTRQSHRWYDICEGLDPALPLFIGPAGLKLDETDAKYVDVIHTDAGNKGKWERCGHIDFYPNGGYSQLGCDETSEYGGMRHEIIEGRLKIGIVLRRDYIFCRASKLQSCKSCCIFCWVHRFSRRILGHSMPFLSTILLGLVWRSTGRSYINGRVYTGKVSNIHKVRIILQP